MMGLAMARTSDPHSATSQFFINIADHDSLNHTAQSSQGWGYAVFGKVLSGLDVMDTIAKTPTMSLNDYSDVPVNDITITSVTRTQ